MDTLRAVIEAAATNWCSENLTPELLTLLAQDLCFQTVREIQLVLADESLNDTDCFMKIEKIVGVFEKNGLSACGRHDFG